MKVLKYFYHSHTCIHFHLVHFTFPSRYTLLYNQLFLRPLFFPFHSSHSSHFLFFSILLFYLLMVCSSYPHHYIFFASIDPRMQYELSHGLATEAPPLLTVR